MKTTVLVKQSNNVLRRKLLKRLAQIDILTAVLGIAGMIFSIIEVFQ